FKLYLDRARTRAWCETVADIARHHPALRAGTVELVVFPTLPAMDGAMAACAGAPIAFGAQDLFQHDRGAYTGAVSGADRADTGFRYAEIGHAERRRLFGDTDAVVAAKVAAAVRNGMTPWLCVGEWAEGPPADAVNFCVDQLHHALAELAAPAPLVVAYEPVWAIGQASAASSAHVGAVVRGLRAALASWPGYVATPVVYGGSAAPGTLTDLGDAV